MDQKFKPWPGQTQTEDQPFEYKPLDLSSLVKPKRRVKRKVRVPCPFCGRPGCFYEKEMWVEEDDT